MNIIEQVLAQVPRPDGFVSAHLVDAGTGQVLADVLATPDAAGTPADRTAAAHALAAVVAQTLQDLGGLVAVHDGEGDLEDMVITLSGHHHLVRVLPDLAGTDAFLLVTLDRSASNLALARHLLRRMEVAVVA